MKTKTIVRGWVVQIGKAPKHRPYVAAGPDADYNDTRVEGGYLFTTRREARAYLARVDDKADCRIRRATVTLEVE